MKNFYIATILLLASVTAWAVKPVEGIWFDLDAGGRGANIEIQDGILVINYFGYGPDRTDRWWQGVGFQSAPGSGVFTGELNSFDGGQCVGCSFTGATVDTENSLGAFTITFTTWRTALFQWAGGTDNWTKFDYAYGTQKDYIFGMWMFSSFFSFGPSASEEVLVFYDTLENEDGDDFAVGNRAGYVNTSESLALANTVEFEGIEQIFILLDSSTSYYLAQVFQLNEDKASGRSWLYRKEESPSGAGLLAIGAKVLDFNEVDFSTNKSAITEVSNKHEQVNDSVHSQISSGEEMDERLQVEFIKMMDALEGLKEDNK